MERICDALFLGFSMNVISNLAVIQKHFLKVDLFLVFMVLL